MNLGERIKKLRKALDLTQQEFADRIGMKRNSIAQVEIGRNTSEQTIFSICREFSVNEDWLRTGTGEMFKAAPSCALDMLADTYHLEHSEYILIEKFVNMKSESRRIIMDYILEVSAAVGDEMAPVDPHAPASPGSIDIEAEVAYYRSQLEEQKKVADGSSASAGHSSSGKKMA